MVKVQSWWRRRLLRGWSGFGLQEFAVASSIRGRAASRGHGGGEQGARRWRATPAASREDAPRAGRRHTAFQFLDFLIGLRGGAMATSAKCILFLPPHPDKWDPLSVWLSTGSNSVICPNCKKNCEKLVDFGSENIKWYHSVHFTWNVVVLC
jgi:hypothetical protein